MFCQFCTRKNVDPKSTTPLLLGKVSYTIYNYHQLSGFVQLSSQIPTWPPKSGWDPFGSAIQATRTQMPACATGLLQRAMIDAMQKACIR